MKNILEEKVTCVHHWNDRLFSFRTTRNPALRFRNGEFIMIGLEVDGKPLMRAYSIASANYEDELEFFSIKVPDGPLTSRLQHLKVGDTVLMKNKATGTLVLDRLLPGKRLYLISTGTGMAPFLSIIKDPETYEAYDKVILTHGVRNVSDLTYENLILNTLPNHQYLEDLVRDHLIYYPTVTREPYHTQGRLNRLIESGKLFSDLGFPDPTPEDDRFMICGSIPLNRDMTEILIARGFTESKRGERADFVIERAFVEK
jgi:ferredoxin--NADP+ reductase